MSKRTGDRQKALLALAATALLALAGGCTGGCSREEPQRAPQDSYARMEDPEYRAALKGQEQERDQILGTLAERRRILKEAEDAGAGEEELARLKADVEAAIGEFEQNRQRSSAIVRQRILQDINGTKQLEGKVK